MLVCSNAYTPDNPNGDEVLNDCKIKCGYPAADDLTLILEPDTVESDSSADTVSADETSEDMKEVMKSTTVATEKINQIVEMLEKDVERMHEVNDSIEQVSSVVDNNSATSEETAAVSEAQKHQVEAMVELMNQFRI